MNRHVAIIGGGIVGAVSAVQACAAGLRVTIIEPGPDGGEQAASYGNSGWLSSHSIIPPALPGVWKKVPAYVLDPLGPLAIRWRYLPSSAAWLVKYLASGWTEKRVETTSRALRSLLAGAVGLHKELAAQAGVPELIVESGLLHAYPTRTAFDADRFGWEIRRNAGISWEELDVGALRAIDPTLAPRYQFGVLVNEAGHCRDPGRYVRALLEHAAASGARRVTGRASGFRIESGRLRAVRLEGGEIPCDAAVIAAGARSAHLAERAGDRVPLESERGYHAMLKDPEVEPVQPVMLSDCKAVATRMEQGLRIAGQVEIAGLDAPPDWRRAHILRKHLLSIYPGLSRDAADERWRYWIGHRPSMPDGRPCIGLAQASRDIVLAFGHGHTGLVGAARTGRLVVQLLSGQEPEISLQPFDPRRFS